MTQAEAYYLANKAHIERKIKPLLTPWLNFKLHMKFTGTGHERTIFGNEHQCTYNQCFHGKVKEIVLNRKKGYIGLVHYIEKDLKGKLIKAKIFTRDANGEFEILCRSYYKGGLMLPTNDPVLSEDEGLILYHQRKKSEEDGIERLVILEENPEAINFKDLIDKSLKK